MVYLWLKHCDCKGVSTALQIQGTIVEVGQWQAVIQLAVQLVLDEVSNSKCKIDVVYRAVSTVDIDLLLEVLPCALKSFVTSLFGKKIHAK